MTESAEQAAALLRRRPGATGILFDFDGTIAPIVNDPETADPLPGVLDALDVLIEQFFVVGIVSARPVEFLVRKLDYQNRRPGLLVVGLFGLEVHEPARFTGRFSPTLLEAPASFNQWRPTIAALAAELRGKVTDPRMVEEKGLGVSLHWRRTPEQRDFLVALAEEAASRLGLEVRRGRAIIELAPTGAPDKGSVVRETVANCEAACYLGDDRSDLLAFNALERLRDDQQMEIVRIGISSSEMPPELRDAADLVLDGPLGAVGFMQLLGRKTA